MYVKSKYLFHTFKLLFKFDAYSKRYIYVGLHIGLKSTYLMHRRIKIPFGCIFTRVQIHSKRIWMQILLNLMNMYLDTNLCTGGTGKGISANF